MADEPEYTEPKPGEHQPGGYFDGPIELKPPTLDSILRWLGVATEPEPVQRATVGAAARTQKLAPLELAELRKQGWITQRPRLAVTWGVGSL